jgi:hypothetical protein
MNRRDFLQIAAVGTLGLGFPGSLAAMWTPSDRQVLTHPDLLELFGDPHTVRELGIAYRRGFPDQSEPEQLARAVLSRSGPRQSTAGVDLQAFIRRRIRRDFDYGETVRLNGWILSVTEARQCAMFSLLHT